jgi:pantoate--beta-alanine ligase
VEVIGSFAKARSLAAGSVGLVPTMGFLHEGHLALLEAARRANDTVMMTLYVNPLQFNEAADLERYPRDLERDLALAEAAGTDVVFAPDPDTMFGSTPATTVTVSALTAAMEGLHRPGHFDGVATVVAKLFAGLQPDRAYFGRKDAQQLAVVRRMAADLSFPIDVVGHPIIREHDGLALSSRNVFLSEEQRDDALALSRGLLAAAELVAGGERRMSRLEAAALAAMDSARGVSPEYARGAAQSDVRPLETIDEPAFLAVAARVGDVRLIDNIHLDVESDGVVADLGIRLDRSSILYEAS